jgi:hypothetical protein
MKNILQINGYRTNLITKPIPHSQENPSRQNQNWSFLHIAEWK